MFVTLIGKTQKGKNRVRDHGRVWEVIKTTDRVLFSPQAGPWLQVVPVKTGASAARWVHASQDQDFAQVLA